MKTIHHVFDVDASRSSVWETVTTRDGLAGWWTTDVEVGDAATSGAVIDFRFGGGFDPDMEVTAVDSGRAVEWACVGGHEPWADNTFRFELEELADDRTRLRFWQHYATELDDDDYGVYNFNWAYYLHSLKDLAETGQGKPFKPHDA